MAEFLFRGKNNGNTPGRWRLGDLVTVQVDGWEWRRLETKAAWIASGGDPAAWTNDFYLVKVPGMSVAKGRAMVQEWTDTLSLGDRSLWRVVIADVPLAIRNIFQANGELTIGVDVTRAQAQAVIRRKDTEANSDLT